MATGRLTMRQTKEILRQKWELGRSHREVAASVGVSSGTVGAVLARARLAGLTAGQLGDLSEEQLEEKLYGWGQEVESNTVEVYVHALRRKLGSGLIQTVRGVGYRLA